MLEVLFRPNLIVKILSVLKSGRYRFSLANGFLLIDSQFHIE